MKTLLIDEVKGEYLIFCHGCNGHHSLTTLQKNEKDAQWHFNGNINIPTFTPSLNVNKDMPEAHCHSFITDGKIQFLDDCFHELKGQTVELPEIEI